MFRGPDDAQSFSGASRGGEPRRNSNDAAAGATILVVDDDPSFCDMIGEFLRDEGYESGSCRSKADACGAIARYHPALVLLDIHLGVRGAGLTVLEALQRNPATMSIPIIVTSADSQYLREHDGLLRGYRTSVLEKPFDLMDLLGEIDSALSWQGSAFPPKPTS